MSKLTAKTMLANTIKSLPPKPHEWVQVKFVTRCIHCHAPLRQRIKDGVCKIATIGSKVTK